jgi:hypothetical protein
VSRAVAWLPVVVLVLAGCAACGEEEHPTGTAPTIARATTQPTTQPMQPMQPSTGQAADGPAAARRIRVGLSEWTISTSSATLPPGWVTLVVTNAGGTEHDLVVRGRAGTWETPDLDPGRQSRLTVRGRAGETLHMWCSMPGHRAQGMHTTLQVEGATGVTG